MNLPKAEQAVINGIYAAVAWLILDFGLLLQEHGEQTLTILVSRPEMAAGAIIVLLMVLFAFNSVAILIRQIAHKKLTD